MWIALYRCLLRFYPAAYRDEFGQEMLNVSLRAEQDARNRSKASVMVFRARELAGLLGGAAREHACAANSRPEQWCRLWSSPMKGLLLYSLGVFLLPRLGVHALFSPATWIMTPVLIAICSWKLGAQRRILGPQTPKSLLSAFAVILLMGASCLFVVTASEFGWSKLITQQPQELSYSIPGMDFTIGSDGTPQPDSTGFRFSAIKVLPDGTIMSMRGSSRPYRALGGILVVLMAFWSRRRNLRWPDSLQQGGTR